MDFKLDSLFAHADVSLGIGVVDDNFLLCRSSVGLAQMEGVASEVVEGCPADQALPRLWPLLRRAIGQSFETSAAVAVEIEETSGRKDFHLTCFPLHTNGAGRLVGFILHQLAHAETHAATAAVETFPPADFAKTFGSVLGHDLRNPLSAIKMGAQMLLTGAAAPQDPRTQRVAARIVNSADRMTRMIEELLDFTRARMGKGLELSKTTFSLTDLVNSLVHEVAAANAGTQIQIDTTEDVVGLWDRDRLSQVVSNLIWNAVVHGGAAGLVSVSVWNDTGSGSAVVEIRNGGVIPSDVSRDMFKPFRIASSSPRRGLGLGLFIGAHIVTLHDGSLTFTSTPEDGTRFRIVLPRFANATAPAVKGNADELAPPPPGV